MLIEREIVRRAERELVLGVIARCRDAGGVGAVGLEAQTLVEQQRAGAQAPIPRRLVRAPCFDAFAVAFHLVAKDEDAARALDAAQVLVLRVEPGHRIGKARAGLRAVAELVHLGDFRAEVRAAGEQEWRLPRYE